MYFADNNEQVLKQAVFTKRSLGRSKILPVYNFKRRVFVLTPTQLRYYDGTVRQKGTCRGTIDLKRVQTVEEVDEDALYRKYCFQVKFDELILYVIAGSDQERKDWIRSLRDEVLMNNNKYLLQKYHSGVYLDGGWTCCKESKKDAQGCKRTYFAKATLCSRQSSNR